MKIHKSLTLLSYFLLACTHSPLAKADEDAIMTSSEVVIFTENEPETETIPILESIGRLKADSGGQITDLKECSNPSEFAAIHNGFITRCTDKIVVLTDYGEEVLFRTLEGNDE